jgi:hypothetical protein
MAANREHPQVRFTVAGGATFVRVFPTMTPESALRYCQSDYGQRSILRRSNHFTVGGSYEWLDKFPACTVELVA